MRLSFCALAVASTMCATRPAHAQFAAYVTSSTSHLSNVEDGSTYTAFALPAIGGAGLHANDTAASGTYTNQFKTYWTSGIGGGVTYNFVPVGPIKLGVDFRGSYRPGTPGADSALIGFKVAAKAPLISFKPYVQASGGYVAARTVNVSTTPTSSTPVGGTFNERYWAYEILGGVDYPIPYTHFFDLRLIEVGGGKGYNVGGLGTARPQMTLFTINSGLVVHF